MSSRSVEFVMPFIDATESVFGSMLGVKITRKKVFAKRGYNMFGDMTGLIGLSGTVSGTASVSMRSDFCTQCIAHMLGDIPLEDVTGTILQDGVGEIINMVAGQARSNLANTDCKFEITLPTMVSGANHEVYYRKGCQCIVVFFETCESGEDFTIEVCIPRDL